MDAEFTRLTDEMIIEDVLGNINMLYAGVGAFFLMAGIFVFAYICGIGKAKNIEDAYEKKVFKKRMLKQCFIGAGICAILASALLVLIENRKNNVGNYHIEIATVTDKRKSERSEHRYHKIYIDKYNGAIDEAGRYDEIDVGDKVYIVVRNSNANDSGDLEDCLYTLDKYVYVGDKLKE